MRQTRTLVGALAAVAALAVTAAPAMAHNFVASKAGTLNAKQYEEIPKPEPGEYRGFEPARMEQFKFGVFVILCYSAHGTGTVTGGPTEVLQLTMHYGSCGWYPKQGVNLHTGASWGKEGLTIRYHANGFLETAENGEEVEWKGELLPSSAAVKVGGKICRIEIPAQTIPVRASRTPEAEYSSVLYSNILTPVAKPSGEFPNSEQERLLITDQWRNIKYTFGGEGTQCTNPEGFEKETGAEGGKGGTHSGNVEVQLQRGNLKYE